MQTLKSWNQDPVDWNTHTIQFCFQTWTFWSIDSVWFFHFLSDIFERLLRILGCPCFISSEIRCTSTFKVFNVFKKISSNFWVSTVLWFTVCILFSKWPLSYMRWCNSNKSIASQKRVWLLWFFACSIEFFHLQVLQTVQINPPLNIVNICFIIQNSAFIKEFVFDWLIQVNTHLAAMKISLWKWILNLLYSFTI